MAIDYSKLRGKDRDDVAQYFGKTPRVDTSQDAESLAKAIREMPAKRESKWNARRTFAHGKWFHSALEAAYYGELLLREKAGELRNVRCQVPYALHVRGQELGKYLLDFAADVSTGGAWIPDGLLVEVKGYDVAFGKWKRRHCELEYGIQIQVVTK